MKKVFNALTEEHIKSCSKCLIPETQDTITFDEKGVCNVCRANEYKHEKIDWASRKKDLDRLISDHRDKGIYDCIVPFSGGKDSAFTLWYLVKHYKVKPLVVSFDHGFLRPNLLSNVERTIKILGVDFMKFRPNWHVVRKLMLESLKRKGDFCWHCHTGIFSYPMHMAIKFKVPVLFWGEPSAEYSAYYGYDEDEEVDEKRFNRFTNLGITAQDMRGMLDGTVTERDLWPFTYPDIKDLRALKFRSVLLGSFIPWDVKEQVKLIKKELGWKEDLVEGVPPEYSYEKIECFMQGIRDYLKFIKRGFGRTAHLAAIDIRNGRLTTEKAREIILKYDGKRPASLDLFLKYVGISEDEFNEIAMSHVIAPHHHDPLKIEKGEPLPDQPQWDTTA